MLRTNAPQPVSRQDFIDRVWKGNYVTGDRGLNHALWTIRSALGDDAKQPTFIRTLPQLGYQWIFEEHWQAEIKRGSWLPYAASIATLVFVTTTVPPTTETHVEIATVATPLIATKAWLWNNDIIVEIETGCRGIIKNEKHHDIGRPVISSDGSRVAFTVREERTCRLVTLELASGTYSDFDSCPAENT